VYIYIMPGQSITVAYHSLIAAVINRAIDDLKGIGPKCRKRERDQAMAFVLSETCEAYCLELEIDYGTIREKAVTLYKKIIAVYDMPRTVRIKRRQGRLSGNRPFPVPQKEILNPYSSPQGSPRSAIN
jgi:hypothetical protein